MRYRRNLITKRGYQVQKKYEKNLTFLEAYHAMQNFLEAYYKRTASDDVGSLLGDLAFLDDNQPADSAAWQDWTKAVGQVLHKEKVK